MCASVWLWFYSLFVKRTILRALRWLLRGLPDDGTCEVPKHAGDLLTSGEHNFCMYSWLYKLLSYNAWYVKCYRYRNLCQFPPYYRLAFHFDSEASIGSHYGNKRPK
jgi:hypothetical protein